MNKTAPMLLRASSLLLASTLLVACGNGGGSGTKRVDIPGPNNPTEAFCRDASQLFTVEADGIAPADGATDVPVNTSVNVRFSHAVDEDSVTASNLYISQGGNALPAIVDVRGTNVTLTPNSAFKPSTLYSVHIGSDIATEVCKNASTQKYLDSGSVQDTTFTTSASGTGDTTRPQLVNMVPAHGSTLIKQDAKIALEFDEPVLPSSINSSSVAVRLKGASVALDGQYVVNENMVSFTPAQPFAIQHHYEIVLQPLQIKDLAGNRLMDLDPAVHTNPSEFHTGGVVMTLNDGLISKIPGVSDLLNGPIADILNQILTLGGTDLDGVDNLVIIKLPLPTDFTDPGNLLAGNNVLIAACDPTVMGPEGCALSLDLGLNPGALQQLANVLSMGNDPQEALKLLADALLMGDDGLLKLDLNLLEPGWAGILPGPLEDAVNTILGELDKALEPIPLLGDLNLSTEELVQLKLLQGSLLDLSVGGLVNINLLDLVNGNLLNLDGPLADALDPLVNLLDKLLCPIRILCK